VPQIGFQRKKGAAVKKLFFLILILSLGVNVGFAQAAKTRFAVVGLDHDHVWGRMNTLLKTPDAELVAIADTHPELIEKAKKTRRASRRGSGAAGPTDRGV